MTCFDFCFLATLFFVPFIGWFVGLVGKST